MKSEMFLKQVKLYDLVRITCIGKTQPQNYTGIVTSLGGGSGAIILQQKNMERIIEFEKIQNVEVIERITHIIK